MTSTTTVTASPPDVTIATIYRVLFVMHALSGLAEDRVVNTFHLKNTFATRSQQAS